MKYIKMFEKQNDTEIIENWLKSMGVDDYKINPDLTVDGGVIRLARKNLTTIMVQFDYVDSFYIQENELTSLKGGPKEVWNYFSCSRNKLTSLQDGPVEVQESYMYYENPCSEDINQLQYIPHDVMLKGKVFNKRHAKGRGYFELKQKDVDEYWKKVLEEKEPLYYEKLVENENKLTSLSNEVSSELLAYLKRGKKLNLWDFK